MTEVTQQAQLDEPERRHLEKIVKQLRERAEETVEYWVHSKLNLAEEGAEAPANLSAEERELRGRVEEAIEREQAGERSWAKARDLYVKGVGYTLVNRLAALRCMEVRGFLDRSPTRFRDDGVTPAADRLITDYFLPREAGIWTAFLVACQERSEEIEILFDLSDPYSLLYGDLTGWDGEPEKVAWSDDLQASLVDLLQDLGGLLDEVEDAVWRADDVLGWVYEYYNRPDLPRVRRKANSPGGIDAEDISIANQFYTPHWVVRMLTDNSLGKLFLEQQGKLKETIQNQAERFSPGSRKNRDARKAVSVEELCTYLVASEEEGDSTTFDHPSEIRVLDPACGSGHFLLYAFDVLERIWWEMEPDVPRSSVPRKILQHNLYGVDLDLRACQLAAFNLYLKARGRAESHGSEDFDMPSVGIVCADSHGLDTQLASKVFDDVARGDNSVRSMLSEVCTEFISTPGLGSLFNPTAQFEEQFLEHGAELDSKHGSDMEALFADFRKTVEEWENEGFVASDLHSLARLLWVLTQDYDVTLMNPPYGSKDRMPNNIKNYIGKNYKYSKEFYINFFEMCNRVTKEGGRVGMLIPRTFMTRSRFESFRKEFLGKKGGFDFLAELGIGVLDNATVRTSATVVKSGGARKGQGIFIRLYDEKENKQRKFVESISKLDSSERVYNIPLSRFEEIPGSQICYSVPDEVLKLHRRKDKIDADMAKIDGKSVSETLLGVQTGNKGRFYRYHWELIGENGFNSIASGGSDAWLIPKVLDMVYWGDQGKEIKRSPGVTFVVNKDKYGIDGLTWTYIKETGRRFGYMSEGSMFSYKGLLLNPIIDENIWTFLGYLNSSLFTAIMLTQTFEREWNPGEVGAAPWIREVEGEEDLSRLARTQYRLKVKQREGNPLSPFYRGSILLPSEQRTHYRYKHAQNRGVNPEQLLRVEKKDTFEKSIQSYIHKIEEIGEILEKKSKTIDRYVYEKVNIKNEKRREAEKEIKRRTGSEIYGSSTSYKLDDVIGREVKRLLIDLALSVMSEDDDGIVLLTSESEREERDLLEKLEEKFLEIWGNHAEDRLREADQVLGSREPTDEPYPNLRHWLENNLFAFHCGEFENTPILWKLTTERLGEDNGGDAGFACLIDYHQLGPDVFDRLSARYLETRKAALRERQQSARRTAEGSEGTQAREARQEEKRCESALREIDELETRISELTQTQPRDWAGAVRDEARDLKPKVRRFRERLEERLETLDALHAEAPSSWFKDHFSDKFMESVGSNRDEWIDALEDLEAACEQFARPADEPVEAHLYDLLPYFDDLTGSTHYSSNGIFFLNYYFSKGKDLAAKIDQGSKDRVTRREQLVAALARETDDDIELGEEINEACQAMKKHMDSDWKPRALEEVRTPGYRPVKKHGVAINITPLAEKKLVPELVEKKVL
ncbi:hypothetical protein GGP94_002667 [Salinibacter ruber]|uniref:BREX-5 system adenine-specific DNA-methyltransferase PglX n=1 Tax=Salinibacter ruber TaxID=146919 RepID=UPI00216A2381|nr:BREX-5 system adenine-specific DNA-methyltransferase PglX [Salinibacter ruber]MCS4162224.1 hypothetical protein [Salinibacter ruber]